jgi:uncharacterized phage protein (TIGR01671 family)
MKMSREIKFRAWLKEDKKIVNIETIDFSEKSIQYLEKNKIIDAYLLRTTFLEDVEIMQYTGIKDKNGTEIYEGDILKDKKGRLAIVKWHGSFSAFMCCFVSEENLYKKNKFLYLAYMNLEVIGNIYENRELLEE